VSPKREGEGRVGPVAVKEKIFEVEHMNSVSMPSTLFVAAGTDAGRFNVRAGRVKLRLPLLGLRARGACSGVWDDAGVDIMGVSSVHLFLEVGRMLVAYNTASGADELYYGCYGWGGLKETGRLCRRSPLLRNAMRFGQGTSSLGLISASSDPAQVPIPSLHAVD
jgi:hypothetical protein